MYARILEFVPKLEKKEEFIEVIKNQVVPILKKQPGFLDALLLYQVNSDQALAISLWTERTYAEPYERDWFPKIQEIVNPYLTSPITVKHYVVETAHVGDFQRDY